MGYAEHTPPPSPGAGYHWQDSINLSPDIVKVLAQHELFFLGLLLLQLLVGILFEILQILRSEDAQYELFLVYPSIPREGISLAYWTSVGLEGLYNAIYFPLGIAATLRGKPRVYQKFATAALLGTLGQLPLAYLNRFNLLIFFLRFIAYAYARFNWNLLYAVGVDWDERSN